MAGPPPPDAVVLMDELVEECLLRLPPEDPADLARAALVSKQWHRVVTGAVFRRRYIEFHRSAPLLGYIDNLGDSIRFVSMSLSFRPRHAHRRDVEAVHSSHGRILLRSTQDRDCELRELDGLYLFVWDPITDKEWELPVLVLLSTPGPDICNWAAALVCAVGDGCSHLNCHFKIVVVGMSGGRMFSCFYSSKSDSWSDRIFVSGGGSGYFRMGSVLVGSALYFRREISHGGVTIVKYDLPTHQMSMISLQLQCEVELDIGNQLIATEDGRLGVAMINNSTLRLWLREQGRLAESRVIQLRALLPDDALRDPLLPPEALVDKPRVAAFADTGAGGVIFLRTRVGYFTIDLNSGRSKKVREGLGSTYIVPYVSFCTPAPGIVSTDEGAGASVVVSTVDEPGAGVVVSRDEGPGDVAVSIDEWQGDAVGSTDEWPGPSMSSA